MQPTSSILNIIAVASGGAIGSVLRYYMLIWIREINPLAWPLQTLLVNLIGSLVLGWLIGFELSRSALSEGWRLFLFIGLCGGFTTFSTFAVETLQLLQKGSSLAAVINAMVSVVLCVLGSLIGMLIALRMGT